MIPSHTGGECAQVRLDKFYLDPSTLPIFFYINRPLPFVPVVIISLYNRPLRARSLESPAVACPPAVGQLWQGRQSSQRVFSYFFSLRRRKEINPSPLGGKIGNLAVPGAHS